MSDSAVLPDQEPDEEPPPRSADQNLEPEDEPAAEDRQTRRWAETNARLREALAKVDTFQREQVERIAAAYLSDPKVLWEAGVRLSDVTDAISGNVDPDMVRERAERLHGAAPPLRHHADLAPQRPTSAAPKASWSSVIRGR
jgi:hypothetical protein